MLEATPDQITVEVVGNPSHPLESCRFITISGPVSEIHNNAGTYEVTWLTQNGEYIWERRNPPAGDPRYIFLQKRQFNYFYLKIFKVDLLA